MDPSKRRPPSIPAADLRTLTGISQRKRRKHGGDEDDDVSATTTTIDPASVESRMPAEESATEQLPDLREQKETEADWKRMYSRVGVQDALVVSERAIERLPDVLLKGDPTRTSIKEMSTSIHVTPVKRGLAKVVTKTTGGILKMLHATVHQLGTLKAEWKERCDAEDSHREKTRELRQVLLAPQLSERITATTTASSSEDDPKIPLATILEGFRAREERSQAREEAFQAREKGSRLHNLASATAIEILSIVRNIEKEIDLFETTQETADQDAIKHYWEEAKTKAEVQASLSIPDLRILDDTFRKLLARLERTPEGGPVVPYKEFMNRCRVPLNSIMRNDLIGRGLWDESRFILFDNDLRVNLLSAHLLAFMSNKSFVLLNDTTSEEDVACTFHPICVILPQLSEWAVELNRSSLELNVAKNVTRKSATRSPETDPKKSAAAAGASLKAFRLDIQLFDAKTRAGVCVAEEETRTAAAHAQDQLEDAERVGIANPMSTVPRRTCSLGRPPAPPSRSASCRSTSSTRKTSSSRQSRLTLPIFASDSTASVSSFTSTRT